MNVINPEVYRQTVSTYYEGVFSQNDQNHPLPPLLKGLAVNLAPDVIFPVQQSTIKPPDTDLHNAFKNQLDVVGKLIMQGTQRPDLAETEQPKTTTYKSKARLGAYPPQISENLRKSAYLGTAKIAVGSLSQVSLQALPPIEEMTHIKAFLEDNKDIPTAMFGMFAHLKSGSKVGYVASLFVMRPHSNSGFSIATKPLTGIMREQLLKYRQDVSDAN